MWAKFFTKNSIQTKKLGEILAKEILKTQPKEKAFVLGLEGGLGGGKTIFLQGFARGLGIKQKILSPTFVLIKRFRIRSVIRPSALSNGGAKTKRKYFYHIDCYRIEKPKELLALGFKKIISNPQNIVAVEWAERIKKILPKDAFILRFQFVNKTKRKIVVKY